jgi:hypothetical protein
MRIDHSISIYLHKPKNNRKFFYVLGEIRIHDCNVRPSKATPAPRRHYDIAMLRFGEEYEKYMSLFCIVLSSAKQTKKKAKFMKQVSITRIQSALSFLMNQNCICYCSSTAFSKDPSDMVPNYYICITLNKRVLQ